MSTIVSRALFALLLDETEAQAVCDHTGTPDLLQRLPPAYTVVSRERLETVLKELAASQLEQVLQQLLQLQPAAQRRYEEELRAELDDDWESDSPPVWLSLACPGDARPADERWSCGFLAQEDEATTWAVEARATSPVEAALAMLRELS